MKKVFKYILRVILAILIIVLIYLLTLFFPQPFYKDHVTVGNITVYSDKKIPEKEMKDIIRKAQSNIEKSGLYKEDTKHNLYITHNPTLWRYFTRSLYKAGGLNYVAFNHSIFLRNADMKNNRLYNYHGNIVGSDRTLDYFMAHEMTHTMEFQSRPFYKYPINTNWVLEGYAEYIAHGSMPYEESLNRHLNIPEIEGAKYYSRFRTMVTYLLEKERVTIPKIWEKVEEYDEILQKAIPHDNPKIIERN